MMGMSFLSNFLFRKIRTYNVADSVDHMNFYYTPIFLVVAALSISAKQYFGSPIQCWVPMEFKNGWEKYTEDLCFIQNLYYVPFDQQIPEESEGRTDQISYYRWVPVVLVLQAVLFMAPNHLWNLFHSHTVIRPDSVLKEARKCIALRGDKRETELRGVAMHIYDLLSTFSTSKSYTDKMVRTGFNATLLYLLTKFLYVINIIGQIIMLNYFLRSNYLLWGYQTLVNVAHGQPWIESPVFPRVILCDFKVRRLGNIQNHTVQCVIMVNMINEKLYLFFWFWFILVAICTIANFFYHLCMMMAPRSRSKMVLCCFREEERKRYGFSDTSMNCFIHSFLRPDGILLFKFLEEHAGNRVSRELTRETAKLYIKKITGASDDECQNNSKFSKFPPRGNYSRPRGYYNGYDKDIQPGTYPSHNDLMESAPILSDSPDNDGTLPVKNIRRAQIAQNRAVDR